MYVGFNLELKNEILSETNKQKGFSIYTELKDKVQQQLDSYISPDGSIDGTKMREGWFPQVDADVFISHSHKDEEKAIALAGWLQDKFGLTAFIDSCIWGYAGDLLKEIDKKFSWNEQSKTYNYNVRNYTTSHVHMMLASALTMMMDKTECIFFMNTPSSVKTEDVVHKTASPWIYHELTMTHIIQKKSPQQHRKELMKGLYKYAESNQLNILYDVNLNNLISLNAKDLLEWTSKHSQKTMETLLKFHLQTHPLDVLYEQKEAVKTN
ncbi:hypothetical protein ACFOUV_13240 [Oceanobacillus longus]|uniref:Toll/interleukin-1 receptor domain-containing protein n=1 Tax=Oceanobacillus longus TaxID=930120 RepID=A0ABV8H0R4_9BACI